jgi:hypothetical protein
MTKIINRGLVLVSHALQLFGKLEMHWNKMDLLKQSGWEEVQFLLWKNVHDLPWAIKTEDAIPFMNKIFFKSYGNGEI